MRRTDRLFELIQAFRNGELLRGKDLADQLGVSIRTLYRDIETLTASGVPIEGERGVGYLLREPIFLPPLTLSIAELEAFNLGMDFVSQLQGSELARAGVSLRRKLEAVVPESRQDFSPHALGVYIGMPTGGYENLAALHSAILEKKMMWLKYANQERDISERHIRPLRLEFLGKLWIFVCWCELRNAFRMFRVDRIVELCETDFVFEDEAGKTYSAYLKQECGAP